MMTQVQRDIFSFSAKGDGKNLLAAFSRATPGIPICNSVDTVRMGPAWTCTTSLPFERACELEAALGSQAGRKPLHFAAIVNSIECVKILCAQFGIEISPADKVSPGLQLCNCGGNEGAHAFSPDQRSAASRRCTSRAASATKRSPASSFPRAPTRRRWTRRATTHHPVPTALGGSRSEAVSSSSGAQHPAPRRRPLGPRGLHPRAPRGRR